MEKVVVPPNGAETAVRRAPAGRPLVQRKLTVGRADDPLEDEADRVADEVIRVLRRSPMDSASPALRSGPSSRIQRHAGHAHGHGDGGGPEVGRSGGGISSELGGKILGTSGGAPLAARERARMEHGFGASFEDVRIHANSELPRQVAADAFTLGRDIHFAPGLYAPASSDGERLLAHELTHVVQQGGASVARHVCDSACGHEISRHVCDSGCGHDDLAFEKRHEHGHVTVARSVAAEITPADTGYAIRRHSSWEHMLIGDLDPKSLATLGAQQDVQNAPGGTLVNVGQDVHGNAIDVTSDDVKHVIQQEINRLKYFQATPPMASSYGDIGKREQAMKRQEENDRYSKVIAETGGDVNAANADQVANQWDLKLVGVPNNSGVIYLVTYGEMNTLGDYFGSIEEMKAIDPKWIGKLIRGVRESVLRELVKVYSKVAGFTYGPIKGGVEAQARAELGIEDEKFRSAHGKNNAVDLGGIANELKLMGVLASGFAKPTVDGDKSTDYSSSLARNACHFAPESWHAWYGYHVKARALAQQAYTESRAATRLERLGAATAGDRGKRLRDDAATRREEAARLHNEALLTNGFGDHYLQDSYAAGHLINKTLIMQQYVRWLDKNPGKWDAHLDKNWRMAQQMSYNQPELTSPGQYVKGNVGGPRVVRGVNVETARNPQTVENTGTDWKVKAEMLGLEVPASLTDTDTRRFLVHWMEKCVEQSAVRVPRTQTFKTLRRWAGNLNLSDVALLAVLKKLFSDGIMRMDSYKSDDLISTHALEPGTKLTLREEYVPKNRTNFFKAKVSQPLMNDMALGVAYNDYLEFMNSSFLQKATNFVHDKFCLEGLQVSAGNGSPVFRIYGDDSMFKANAGPGLLHSGETAHMSRNAIISLATTGAAAMTEQQILARLPAEVQTMPGHTVPLDQWHTGALLNDLENGIFESMSNAGKNVVFNKGAVGAARNLGQITKTGGRPSGHEVF